MFLIPAADVQDENGVVALFAEDFNFASLWALDQDARDYIDNCEAREVFENREAPAPVI